MNELELIKNQAESQIKLINEFGLLKDKQELTDKRLGILERTLTLNRGEAFKIKHKIQEKAEELTKMYFDKYVSKELYGKKKTHLSQAIHYILKRQFQAVSYTTILHVDYVEAYEFIKIIQLKDLPSHYLRLTEHQYKVSLKNKDGLSEDFRGAHINHLKFVEFEM